MKKNEQFVITINRELGSGGRTVGRKLAVRLGVNYYDKALIQALQDQYHLTVEEIEKMKGQKHTLWTDVERILNMGPGINTNYYLPQKFDAPEPITTDEMFKTETEILKNIAKEMSCVVAGRSGFYVFREHPNHLSILIQASMPHRMQRVARKQNISEEEARKIIDKVDEMRENYVKKYTKSSRYDSRNYNLVINMDGISEDDAVDIILDYINRQSGLQNVM